MGKHSASKPATRGSLKDLFGRRKSSAGRHSEPVSAAGVLASGRRAPVMAAIAIPTAAIATIAVAGVVNNGQGSRTLTLKHRLMLMTTMSLTSLCHRANRSR